MESFFSVLLAAAAWEESLIWLFAALAWLVIIPYSFKFIRNSFKKQIETDYRKQFILNANDVDNAIEKISRREGKISLCRWYLGASFFPITIAFMVLYYFNVKAKNGELLVIQYCIYALMLIAGYFWNKYLGKKLDKLYEEKVEYIDFRELFK